VTAPVERATDADAPAASHPNGSQAFWAIIVAVPAALSLLRVWIEAGGQLQTTLLIVGNVNTVNLFATMFLVGTRDATMALVSVFALGGLLGVSATAAQTAGRPLRRRPLFARWADATPLFVLVTTFVLAVMTWQILYLPLLLPAFVMTFQAVPSYRGFTTAERLAAYVVVLVAYGWLTWPTIVEAQRQREFAVLLLFVLPPLLVPLTAGAVPRNLTRLLAQVGQPATVFLGLWALLPALTAPILPLTVTTLSPPAEPSYSVRGYVINSDEQLTAILQERGGIRYVGNGDIVDRVLCPSAEELPVYRMWVRGLHVEDSLLEAWGRQRRPTPTIDAACRSTPDASHVNGGRAP
jgi:hypothetical protein